MCDIRFQKIKAKSGVILYISKNLFLIPDICLGIFSASALLEWNLIINHQKCSSPGASSAEWLVITSHISVMQSFSPHLKNIWEGQAVGAESGRKRSFKMVETSVLRFAERIFQKLKIRSGDKRSVVRWVYETSHVRYLQQVC